MSEYYIGARGVSWRVDSDGDLCAAGVGYLAKLVEALLQLQRCSGGLSVTVDGCLSECKVEVKMRDEDGDIYRSSIEVTPMGGRGQACAVADEVYASGVCFIAEQHFRELDKPFFQELCDDMCLNVEYGFDADENEIIIRRKL